MWEIAMGIYLLSGMICDLVRRELSVKYLIVGTVFSTLYQILNHKNIWYMSVCGALLGCGFLLLSKCTKEQIGYGDSWMILNLGIFLGIWKLIFMLSVVFGFSFLFSCIGLVSKKLTRRTRIPFYPFLMLGYIGVMIW